VSTFSRCIFFFVLVTACLSCGCGVGTNSTPTPANSFPAVVFSDIHFNPFDDATLCPSLAAADVSAWAGIFKGSSKATTLPAWQSDTNYPLLVLALSGIKQNLGASPIIIYTGDLLGHNFATLFYQDCKFLPTKQSPTPQDVADMQAFADTTAAFVMQQVRSTVGSIPVMFVVGNSDSYTGLGPDSIFLSNTVQLYYTNFVNGTPANYPEFFNTFTSGGYYSAEPMGKNLMVIGLNTNPFAPPYPGLPSNDSAVYAELAWLDTTLASAQAAGQKVWLLMHIPPGADTVTSATNFAASGSLTTATAAMMWVQAYQESFLQILSKYPGIITLALGAHTHRDEFRIMSPDNVLDITPSISPYFGNDPAFKVFTFTQDTFTPTDYSSLNYDLAANPGQFNSYYTFSKAYSMQGPLDSSLAQLYPALVTNNAKQALYIGQYNSGNNSPNPNTNTNWNPITNENWPVFACGIGKMAQLDFEDCVNSY
jgi:sphingomyelin phosphodiesterase acid-like 3